jgi:hypothetical protein
MVVFYTRGAGGCNADLPIRSRPFIQLNGLVVLVLVVLMRVMLPCLNLKMVEIPCRPRRNLRERGCVKAKGQEN